jgi:hypothetical protein
MLMGNLSTGIIFYDPVWQERLNLIGHHEINVY